MAWDTTSSLAIDAGGAVHLAYEWNGDGGRELRTATHRSGAWDVTTVLPASWTNGGANAELAIDSTGAPHVCFEEPGDAAYRTRHARPSDCAP